jgi:hypothetical protein
MSKLGREILNQDINKNTLHRIPAQVSCASVSSDVREDRNTNTYELQLGVKLNVRQVVQTAHDNVLLQAKRRARRQIIEEVFGEFRGPLIRIDTLIHSHDLMEASAEVNKILAQMFDEEKNDE